MGLVGQGLLTLSCHLSPTLPIYDPRIRRLGGGVGSGGGTLWVALTGECQNQEARNKPSFLPLLLSFRAWWLRPRLSDLPARISGLSYLPLQRLFWPGARGEYIHPGVSACLEAWI